MSKKKNIGRRHERDHQLGGSMSVFFRRKNNRSSQEVNNNEDNKSEDSRLMRRNKAKNLPLFLSEIMKKLKHSFKKKKPQQHDKRLLEKKKKILQRTISPTKDHFFLERMTSISQKKTHQEHFDKEKHLSDILNNGDFDENLARRNQVQRNRRRIASFREFSSVLSRSASDADDVKEIVHEISNGETEDEILKESLAQLSLLSVDSPSRSVIEPLLIEYEVNPARGEAQEKNHQMDEKESVFNYVKVVLDAIDSNWEELYLKTSFCDQLFNPALISNIPFYPNQLCADHELLFDCINEVLFELCRFPQCVKPFFSFSVESIVHEVQTEVYFSLLPSLFDLSLEQIVREDMDKPGNWLDIRCDLECIGFETSEMILNELLEELVLQKV